MSQFTFALMRILSSGMLLALAVCAAAQQAYPTKPIRFISPYPPGGTTSVLGRLVGQKLTEVWGQPVILDNRPGNFGVVSADALLKAPRDGHSIMLISGSSHVIYPLLISGIPYDAIKDFDPIATIAGGGQVLLINPSVPANNLRELIALAKSKPGELNYASSGGGGLSHLSNELLNSMAGLKMQHIPYKGTGPAMTDLLGAQVQMFFGPPIIAIAHVKGGRLKAIAITSATRLSALPQVPTFAEAGLPGFEINNWYGILAAVGTPKEIIGKMSAEIARIVVLPEVKEILVGQGMDPIVSTPEQLGALMKSDTAKYAKIIRDANIKLEQ